MRQDFFSSTGNNYVETLAHLDKSIRTVFGTRKFKIIQFSSFGELKPSNIVGQYHPVVHVTALVEHSGEVTDILINNLKNEALSGGVIQGKA